MILRVGKLRGATKQFELLMNLKTTQSAQHHSDADSADPICSWGALEAQICQRSLKCHSKSPVAWRQKHWIAHYGNFIPDMVLESGNTRRRIYVRF